MKEEMGLLLLTCHYRKGDFIDKALKNKTRYKHKVLMQTDQTDYKIIF